jgi:outer membrane protein assembly factor BamA/autotransporter translocation and assembly factor TamB
MGSRLLRVLATATAVVVILGLALVALLHLPPVRSRALSWVVAELESRYDLLLTSDRLSYNLVSGGVTLTNVRLAARGFADQPFFTATRVHADVPLAAYAGRLILDDVAVEAGRLTIVTDAQGRSNLPERGEAPPPAEPGALALGGLHLHDFAFLYDDRQTPMRISATGIESALDDPGARVFDGATGPFAVRGGVDVKWRDRALHVEPFESRLGFDGRNVSLEDVRLVTTMGGVSVSGALNRVLDALSLELGFDGEVDLARAVEWAPPPVPVAGTTRVRGTMSGPTNAIELVTRFDAASLSVGTEPELAASGEILIDKTRLIANRLIVSPHSGGEINAALDLPFADAPLSLTAAWQGVDARVLMRAANVEPQPIATRLDGAAKFTSGSERALTLKTDLAAMQERGATPLAGEVSASLKGDDWSVTHNLRADGVTVTGRAEGQLDAENAGDSTIAGPSTVVIASLAAADRTLAPLGIRVPEAIRDSGGAIEAEAAIGGTVSNPRTTVVAHAPAFDLPGVGPTALDATIEVDRRAVFVSPLTARRDGTEASGDVSLDLTSRSLGGTLHVTVADALALQTDLPEQWRVSGALDADVWLMGTLDAPVIQSWVASPTLEFAGDTYTDLQGGIEFSNRTFSTTQLWLNKDGGQLAVRGQFGLDRSYQAEIDATNLSWSRVIVGETPTRLGLNGRFSGAGTLDRPVGEGTFKFQLTGGVAGDLVGEGTLTASLIGDLARLTVVEPTNALFANGTVALASPYDYRAVGVINQLDIAKLVPLLEIEPGQLSGHINATAAVTGAIDGDTPPTVQANLQQIDAQLAGVPFTLVAPASVGWQPGELTVRNFTASLGTGTLTAEGAWGERAKTVFSSSYRGDIAELATAGRAFGLSADLVARGWTVAQVYATSNRQDLIASVAVSGGYFEAGEGVAFSDVNTVASLEGEHLTLDSLTGRLDAAKAGGTFAGKGEATIPELDPMRAVGRFALDSATFDSAGLEVKQTRPTTISIDKGLITMDDVVWEAAGSQLALGGSVDVSAGSPALNLNVEGIAVLRALSAFVPRLGVDGTADVNVRIGGTASNPDLSGTITLADAEIALSSPRLVISELSGPIVLSANRIDLRGLNGSANGGTLTIDGGFLLRGTAIADGEVYVQAAGLAVEYPAGLRSEVDALLIYNVKAATPVLSGDVRVQRAAYTQPISLAALARGGNSGVVRTLNQESALEQLRLNIDVTTVEDIRVDNNYGRLEGSAQLRIVGTAAQPGMSGQVTLREGGQIYAVGRTFRLERGTISFTDLNRIRPDLDIRAITRVSNLGDVTMTLQGTPDRFEFDLTSEEDASREEIAQALVGGGATGVNALALLSSDLLGATGRQLGLDALRIEQGDVVRDEFREDPSAIAQDDANPVTRLTMSKRLRDNVEFTLSQNLAENGKTTFLVSYYPLANLELRAISRDDGTQGVGVRHQITFGGDPAARAAPPREELKVAEVRPEGNLSPFTEAEIREELKVKPGDTLNFYEWQQDLDNLTARYVERGHYEVRVRGRRDPAGEGAVNVIYAINAGPATRIQVDGFEVAKEDLEAIQLSWSRGVFDRFIVQDAEARVKQRLLLRGYVNGVVTGTMESSGAAKTLHLTVVPGTPAGSRGMRFTGNAGVSRNELEAVVQQTGMDVRGWIDRGGLEQTLTTYYRNEGYLGAKVTVQEPIVENDRGVLPVSIEEGSRSTIREIHWSGVSDSHAAGVQKVAGLSPGASYTLAALDGARDRIDRYYRTLGHNAVQVSATGIPVDKGPPVDVNMAVVEGPQQVLQEVETVGATRTREGIVSRALRLPVGRPVNLEEWALARKRLFDTNVFRSVDIQAVPIGDAVDGVQQVRALVTVEEYPPWRFRYGFQVDRNRDDSSAEALESAPPEITYGGIAEIRNQNLFGRALTGGVATRVELDFQRVNTFIQTASFFGLPLRSGLFIYGSRERVRQDAAPLFIEEIQGTSFEQRWRRRRGFEITYGYRFERTHVYDPEPPPGEIIPFDQVFNDGRLTGAFLLDRRDDPVNASRGTFSSVSVERAAAWLASDTSYTRFLVQQTAYLKTGPVVLAGRVMTGRAWGSDIPPDQRFLAGGATTVRGYGENVLGPRNEILGSIGGTELLILNQELRFPLYRWFRGVGFLDVGNTFDRTYPFSWAEMKVGYGAGLRLDSPIGLLRLDFGIPGSTIPNSGRQPNTFSSGRWYFGIGHVF